jgi:beta-lactamase regulating signal transducer with metallopeptidase domain
MTVLATWLWQGILLAAATMAVLHFATRLNAASRYALAWAGVCAVLLLPVPGIVSALVPGEVLPLSAIDVPGMRPVAPLVVGLPDWLVSVAVGVWLGTVFIGALRLALSLRTIIRLRAASRPMPPERQAELRHWAEVSSSGRRAELRVSSELTGACAIGLRRPMIVVSERLCAALTDADLDRIVIHEYGHLVRFDDWTTLGQAAIETVVGFHPAIRWLCRQIDLEREAACDDRVVTLTGDARPYATCLTTVARVARYQRLDDALMPSALRTRSTLHTRVVRLLDSSRRRGHSVEHRLVWPAAGVLALVVVLASQMSPLVVLLEAEAGGGIDKVVRSQTARLSRIATPDSGTARPDSASTTGSPSPDAASRIEQRPPVVSNARAPRAAAAADVATRVSRTQALAPAHAVASQPSATLRTTNSGLHATVVHYAPAIESKPMPRIGAATDEQQLSNPWITTGQRAAAAGVVTGVAAKRTGTSIAGFFTRASKALARSF